MNRFWIVTISCIIFGKASVGQDVDLGSSENFANVITGDVTSNVDSEITPLEVSVPSSLAAKNLTQFVTDLTTIRDAGKNTFDAFYEIVNGYSSISDLIANYSSGTEEYDEETIVAINNVTEEQITSLKRAWDTTRDGLKPIADNATVLTTGEDEIYATLEAWIELVSTVFNEFPSTDYSTTLEGIEDIENVAIPKIGDIWIQVYDVIVRAISSDSLEINNVLQTITRTATGGAKVAFTAVFAEFKTLPIELSYQTEAQREACSIVSESQKSLALSLVTSEVHTKFTLFQYIATSRFINDSKIITDLNKIQATYGAILSGFQSGLQPIFDALIEFAEEKNISSSFETLRETLSSGLDLAFVNTIVALSYMQTECSGTVAIVESEGFAGIDIMVGGIIAAVESIQNTNSSEALAKVEAIEEIVVTAAVQIYEVSWATMADIASDIDDNVVAAIESYSNKSSAFIESAMRRLFAAIKILVVQDDDETSEAGCSADVIAIKTAQAAIFSDLNGEMWLKFDSIRATHLLATLKDYGISVDPSSLLYESY